MDPYVLAVSLEQPATYLHWGWVQISVPNLVVILVMLLLFGLAVLLPFPQDRGQR